MAEAFGEERDPLDDAYVDALLGRRDFWAVVVFAGDQVVAGATAHVLPMTRSQTSELFIYDLAVHPDQWRKGFGRLLISELLEMARREQLECVFVPADNEDTPALEFYRALGGEASPVTLFVWPSDE